MTEIMNLLKWIYSTWLNLPTEKKEDFITAMQKAVKEYLGY